MTTNAHQFVYLLSQRGPNGADRIVATLDRAQLPRLLDCFRGIAAPVAQPTLDKLLGFTDDALAQEIGHQCEPGRGSVQLHVIPLA